MYVYMYVCLYSFTAYPLVHFAKELIKVMYERALLKTKY